MMVPTTILRAPVASMSLASWILWLSMSLIAKVSVLGGESKTKYAACGSTCWPERRTGVPMTVRRKLSSSAAVRNKHACVEEVSRGYGVIIILMRNQVPRKDRRPSGKLERSARACSSRLFTVNSKMLTHWTEEPITKAPDIGAWQITKNNPYCGLMRD